MDFGTKLHGVLVPDSSRRRKARALHKLWLIKFILQLRAVSKLLTASKLLNPWTPSKKVLEALRSDTTDQAHYVR